jgi:hypothetical protein
MDQHDERDRQIREALARIFTRRPGELPDLGLVNEPRKQPCPETVVLRPIPFAHPVGSFGWLLDQTRQVEELFQRLRAEGGYTGPAPVRAWPWGRQVDRLETWLTALGIERFDSTTLERIRGWIMDARHIRRAEVDGMTIDHVVDTLERLAPPAPEAQHQRRRHNEGKGAEPRQPTPKRSTERGEGRAKLIAALTEHHKYADGSYLNLEPVGSNELARKAEVSKATASAFFKTEFQGYAKYRVICRDAGRLADSLKALNGEFSPHDLYGRRPADEDARDED